MIEWLFARSTGRIAEVTIEAFVKRLLALGFVICRLSDVPAEKRDECLERTRRAMRSL